VRRSEWTKVGDGGIRGREKLKKKIQEWKNKRGEEGECREFQKRN
jgi:hypothetical protein